MPDNFVKAHAFLEYRRARQVLDYNRSFNRPGQDTFVKMGENRVAEYEERFPDFAEEFAKIYGARYARRR